MSTGSEDSSSDASSYSAPSTLDSEDDEDEDEDDEDDETNFISSRHGSHWFSKNNLKNNSGVSDGLTNNYRRHKFNDDDDDDPHMTADVRRCHETRSR